MIRRRAACATLTLLALGLATPQAARAETWRFALIGDTPYSRFEREEFPQMMADIVAEHPQLIVHIGDFKKSSEKCSDAVFLDRKTLFDASPVPFVYVPGDNEWTDCKRLRAGQFDALERLARLRELFFAEPFSLGRTRLAVERQSPETPEHLRWRLGPLLFASLNVPGPDNHYGNSSANASTRDEFMARNPKVIAWLREAFAVAKKEHRRGVVIAMQGNPDFALFEAGLTHAGYQEIVETLRQETMNYSGQVLLLHGDTHWQRVDHPLRHPKTLAPLANFTRAESYGYPFMGWVKIIVDSETPGLFRFEAHSHTPQRAPLP